MSAWPTGTVTFLFTDIEESTPLWERAPDTARAVVERHLTIIREAVIARGGVPFKTIGDATQSAFPSAPRGVAAALAAQRALLGAAWPAAEDRPRVRMALHAGAAEPRDGDYLAGCLNRLSRLLDATHGDQILLSQTMAALAGDALPADCTLEPLGEHRLRDILQPEEIFQLRHPALPAEFPPLVTPGQLPHNLPIHPTPFLGRERELDEVLTLLQHPEVRLLTLTGPGGVGKTRLALRVAAEALESFPDGAFLIDLARQTDPALVPSAVATTLGLREQPGQTLTETLADYLRERRMLLLLDNFEHLLPAATLAAELLAAAPELKILATSRARLELRAEHEYRVETLPVPDPASLPPLDDLARYDAVALFVTRARALRHGFALTEGNARAVAAIVSRLDGLPLAIELAAARIKFLPPDALLDRLDHRLATLTGGARDLPPRQQTLRNTIAWSHDLLAPEEQVLFRRLSVFVGGWTLAGAEAMAALDAEAPLDALTVLSALVDQSLVVERPWPGILTDEPRFGMLETIREFAGEQLAASADADQVEHAFETFLADRAVAAEDGLSGPEQPFWLDRLEAEHDNLRAALGRILERGDSATALRLASPLWRFWRMRGHPGEGRAWLERSLAVAATSDETARADAEFGIGKLSIDLGDHAAADAHFRSCLALRRKVGNPLAVAEVLSALSIVAVNLRHYDEARALGEEALQICREQNDLRGTANALHDLGLLAREQGDLERATELFDESMAIWRQLGEPFWLATVKQALGVTHRLRGDSILAQRMLDESGAQFQKLSDRFGIAVSAAESGHLARARGDISRAIALYGEALNHFNAIGASEAVVYCVEWLATAAVQVDPRLTLHLLGAAMTARQSLRLSPPGESDAEMVARGLAQASRLLGNNAKSALATGRTFSLDRARDESLRLVRSVKPASPSPCAQGAGLG